MSVVLKNFESCWLAGPTLIAKGAPFKSTIILFFTPRLSLSVGQLHRASGALQEDVSIAYQVIGVAKF